MSKTIGQVAHEQAEEYYTLYVKFKQEFGQDRAENLALHDLTVRQVTTEFALEELRKRIKEEQSQEVRS